ncbi:putative membrane protein [Peptoniphilus sp. ING2-D1G]|nr:putative membrane protein [Peptoniphilus sp. ING2-D1G]
MNKNRIYEITAGIAFLVATLSYSIGSFIVESELTKGDFIQNPSNLISQGLILEFVNSIAVIIIGICIHLRFKKQFQKMTFYYLISRILEGVLLALGGILSIKAYNGSIEIHQMFFNLSMLILGIYSVFFFNHLRRKNIGPSWLMTLGTVGYLSLAIYSIVNVVGKSQIAPMLLFGPGAIFEIAFPLWLIFKGFKEKEIRYPASF